jgi:CHAD domain-containing protein
MVQHAGSRLVTAFQKQTEKVSYFCSAENISPNLAIHEIRKSFKRMRALLHFYSDFPDEFYNHFNTQMRNFGIYLSPIRESFVNIQIFERISSSQNLIAEKKIKDVKEFLAERNKTLVETEYISNKGCELIHEFVQVFETDLLNIESERPSLHQMVSQLNLSFQEAFELFQQIEMGANAEEMHRLRKKLKRLWYQFDFIKYVHPRYFKLKSDQLNKITEYLGEDHDLNVFIEHLKLADIGFNPEEMEIITNQVQHLQELNLLRLTPKIKQFFQDTPEVFKKRMEKIFKLC